MSAVTRDSPLSGAGIGGARVPKHMRARLTANVAQGLSTIRYRAFDSGLACFVTWTKATLTPSADQTTPNYTGSLGPVHVEIP